MLILGMILRITRFTQEELAKYIGVSRASINSWLSDDSTMSDSSKKLIADKFGFPVAFFQTDLNQNIEYYKLVFSVIFERWKEMDSNVCEKENSKMEKVNDILDQIYSNTDSTVYEELGEFEILEGLSNGYNPYTGEVFDDNHILNDDSVKSLLQKLYKYYLNGNILITKDDLTEEQYYLFEELRKWRKYKYASEGYFNAYIVFNDQELINIVTSDIREKEDLIKVKGIGVKKYEKYADELYEIITSKKFDDNDIENFNVNLFDNVEEE